MIIPAITGDNGIVKKGFKEKFGTITGKCSIHSLKKTAIFGTSHITRKVLQSDIWSLSGGYHRWFKRGNVKAKFTLEQATKAQRGSELDLYSFFNFSARWGGW
jgi:hypothetical protein